jgi:hypothetical protein
MFPTRQKQNREKKKAREIEKSKGKTYKKNLRKKNKKK